MIMSSSLAPSTVVQIVVAAYLLGSIPFGYLLYRLRQGGDVRSIGSGNTGATNVLRGAGLAAGAATLVLDGVKGYVAVALAGTLSGHDPKWVSVAAVVVVLGHMYPVFLKLRGGKGVATSFGAFLVIAPLPVLCVAGIFAIVAALTRYVSLASILAVLAFPIALYFAGGASIYALAAAVICAILIVFRHRSNIHRLMAGEERHFERSREVSRGGSAHS
jgi:glycerol-3-phosphate acyltransferase PlsY